MTTPTTVDLSAQLKAIAKDLSFLGRPRYPLHELRLLFPEHRSFIDLLDNTTEPFPIDHDEKKKSIDLFHEKLLNSELSPGLREIFHKRAQDYAGIVRMMEHFGTSFFYEECMNLYGSSRSEKSDSFFQFLSELPKTFNRDRSDRSLGEEEARTYLREKLLETFPKEEFEVKASSSLLSDSSAGRKVLKLNPHKLHSIAQLEIFLVHEGWVHLGTSINGSYQTHHPWLSSWAPRTTHLQEGLAILTEIITQNMTLERWLKVRLRHEAVILAERGSSITDVYHYLLDHRFEKTDALKLALRVFRGVPLDGGMAFTKELLYLQGLKELLSHLTLLKAELSSLWFGKMSFAEHKFLHESKDHPGPSLRYFPNGLLLPEVSHRLAEIKGLAGQFF